VNEIVISAVITEDGRTVSKVFRVTFQSGFDLRRWLLHCVYTPLEGVTLTEHLDN
jgi:hypothetical protein